MVAGPLMLRLIGQKRVACIVNGAMHYNGWLWTTWTPDKECSPTPSLSCPHLKDNTKGILVLDTPVLFTIGREAWISSGFIFTSQIDMFVITSKHFGARSPAGFRAGIKAFSVEDRVSTVTGMGMDALKNRTPLFRMPSFFNEDRNCKYPFREGVICLPVSSTVIHFSCIPIGYFSLSILIFIAD